MSNKQIAKMFKDIADAYTIKDEKKFRFQLIAYQKASETIAGLTVELKDLYLENKLDQLPGIGRTIKSHIEELFKTGKVSHFDWVLSGIPKSVFILTEIPTFGPKKAFKLVTAFKLNNPENVIKNLKKVCQENKVSKLDGFGDKSQADIIRAISEYESKLGKLTRMTLPYAFELSEKILEYLQKNSNILRCETLGSLRRRSPTIGDLDIAVATNKPAEVLEYFTKYPHLDRIIEKGDISASILVSGGQQVDLLIQPIASFGSLLQHFTGSKNHNIHLREVALKKNLSLSEHGIKDLNTNKINKYDKEENFYNAIGLQWIPPELREDLGEIELAQTNNLPDLIKLEDLKGDLHIHSNFAIEPSHDLGQSTMEEHLEKARLLKYEYIGFSEHNPSQAKHSNKKIYELISKRNEKIEQIYSNNKYVRVIKMLETDILPSGKLAIDAKSLGLLDATIVSIHSVFNLNKFDMTKRIIEGLSHKKAKILAHPTGRMLNERNGYDIDWNIIFDFCKTNNKALEINSWPNRLDLSDSLIKIAIENKVKLIINSDSHFVNHMDNQKYGIFMARRGWATKYDILNTLEYNKFIDWINL